MNEDAPTPCGLSINEPCRSRICMCGERDMAAIEKLIINYFRKREGLEDLK